MGPSTPTAAVKPDDSTYSQPGEAFLRHVPVSLVVSCMSLAIGTVKGTLATHGSSSGSPTPHAEIPCATLFSSSTPSVLGKVMAPRYLLRSGSREMAWYPMRQNLG